MVATRTGKAEGFDIVCSIWKHIAVNVIENINGLRLTTLSEHKGHGSY